MTIDAESTSESGYGLMYSGRSFTSFEVSGSEPVASVDASAEADSVSVEAAEAELSWDAEGVDSALSPPVPEHPARARAATMGSVMTAVRDTMLQEYLDCSAEPKGTSARGRHDPEVI